MSTLGLLLFVGGIAHLGILVASALVPQVLDWRRELSYAHSNLGALLCDELGEYDQAIESFRKAIELDPEFADASNNLRFARGMKGWSLVSSPDPKLRDPKRAIETIKEVVELDPQSAGAWQCSGWVEYRLGNWRASVEALDCFEIAI